MSTFLSNSKNFGPETFYNCYLRGPKPSALKSHGTRVDINLAAGKQAMSLKMCYIKYHGLFVRSSLGPFSNAICRKLTRDKQVLRHVFIASANLVTAVRYNP